MKLYSGGVPEQNQKIFKFSDQILNHNFCSADMCTEEDRQMIGRDRGLTAKISSEAERRALFGRSHYQCLTEFS